LPGWKRLLSSQPFYLMARRVGNGIGVSAMINEIGLLLRRSKEIDDIFCRNWAA
jgi:hypothetical protein